MLVHRKYFVKVDKLFSCCVSSQLSRLFEPLKIGADDLLRKRASNPTLYRLPDQLKCFLRRAKQREEREALEH